MMILSQRRLRDTNVCTVNMKLSVEITTSKHEGNFNKRSHYTKHYSGVLVIQSIIKDNIAVYPEQPNLSEL